MIFIIFYILGLIAGLISIVWGSGFQSLQIVSQTLLQYQLVVTVGLTGLIGFTGHVFNGEKIAKHIGWASGSPFQTELGFTELGYGIAGIMCFWYHGGFWLATIITISTLFLGASYVHIKEMVEKKNFNPGNSISTVPDLIIPITLIVLSLLSKLW